MNLNKKTFMLICSIACIISVITTLFFVSQYIAQHTEQITYAKKQALEKTNDAVSQINTYTRILEHMVLSLAENISEENLSTDHIIERLREKPVEVSGFGIAYASSKGHTGSYYVEHEGKQQLMHIEGYAERGWFSEPFSKGAQFQGPFAEEQTQQIVVQYAAPFYHKGSDKPAGIIFARQSINHIQHILSTLYLGQTGYWFIVSRDGTLLVHPNTDFVYDKLDLNGIAEKYQLSMLKEVSNDIAHRKAGFKEYYNEMTQNKSWLFYEPIEENNWTLCGVFDLNELQIDIDAARQLLITIICFALLSLLCATLYAICLAGTNIVYLWTLSGLSSVGLMAGLIGIWTVTQYYPHYRENLLPIYDKADLYTFIDTLYPSDESSTEQSEHAHKHLKKEYRSDLYVPTGIYINHLKLIEQNQISFTGYVWQRYIDGIHDNVSRGFILPQATSDDEITELYRTKHNGQETIIWHVKATLNQTGNHVRYPFDVKDIQVRLRHIDFEKDVTLIPDLDSYPIINPSALPGVSENIYLSGWNVKRSYFGYATIEQQSFFGLYEYGPFGIYKINKRLARPGLHLNVVAQRSLLDTLISDLLPIMVILFLLFIALLLSAQQQYAILGTCATIFFGAIFAEVRFHSKIPYDELVYFEHFYLIIYGALFATLTVAILYLLNFNIRWIRYEHNRITKLLFFPIILLQAILVTVYYLY